MPAPSWGKPLPFPIVIADRRNNRLIEVTPDKRIVWVFDSPYLKVYRGNEDVNFAADGKVMTADIRNCRILFVDRETLKIATQWGKPGQCKHDPPNLLAFPNGATPLANGDILVSEISGSWISRITREGKVLWSVQARKIRYPSDAFPTWDDLRHRVVVIDRETKAIVWQYGVTDKAGNAAGELHYPDGFDIDVFRDWKPAVAPKRP